MVELKTIKRKRSQKDKSSRYPLSVQFSSLTYRQAPESLALSCHNVLTLTSTRPHPHQFSTIAGDVFSLDMPIRKIPIKNVEQYHKQHTITHLKWHQKGNTLASIDETGHLALWQINHTVHDWKLVYQTDLKQPLAAFLWLQSDRMYIMQDTIKRDGLYGPRNPYGQLGFITVTTHGVITVHYQRNGTIFSSFSTPLPNIGRREISRANAGCFGMSLTGFDDWERISHADIILHQHQIYLATHNASLQHKTVWLHTIDIQFPKKKEGTIVCKPLTSLKLKQDRQVTQLMFKQGSASLECVIGLGQVSHGCIATYQLQTMQQTITSDLGTIQHERTCLVHQSSTEIQDRFITALTCTHQGHILAGLSDGSVHYENKDKTGHLEVDYWQVVAPQQDSIADIVLSPNQTHVVYLFSSMALGVTSLMQDLPDISQRLQLCLLNNQDYTDLISELVRMPQPVLDTVIHDVLRLYESYLKDTTSLAYLEKAYGFALAVYRRLPNKQVQYTNFSRAIQLPLILECFISSSSHSLDETTEFDVNSLWSLVSLSTWIYDYVRWLLREWYLLFHRKPHSTHITKPVYAVLLLHKESRSCLYKILLYIRRFIAYTNTSQYALESRSLLQRYTCTLFNQDTVDIADILLFLEALDDITHIQAEHRWSLLVHSTLDGFDIHQIQSISNQHKDKCAKPSIYIEKAEPYPYDVIRKRRLGQVKTYCCMRCNQPVLATHPDKQDPYQSASWYQSIGQQHCICGGLFA